MKKTLSLCFTLLLLVFSGCKKTALILYGVRNPEIENHQSMTKSLEKSRLPVDEIIAAADISSLADIINTNKMGIPEAAFFNKRGEFLPYLSDSITCNAGVTSYIGSLNRNLERSVDSSVHIESFIRQLVSVSKDDTTEPVVIESGYDYFILLFWTIYSGRLTRNHLPEWLNAIREQENRGVRIRYYLVNLDIQEFWGLSEEEISKIKFN